MAEFAQIDEPIEWVKNILEVTNRLNKLKDIDAILDRILTESRRLSNAESGTIYLVENGKLRFSYIQNDAMTKSGEIDKTIYSNVTLPMDESSIVGFVAREGRELHIEDAYDIPPDLPIHFNPGFDESSGYRTTSMLTMPIKSSRDKVVGVIQIINARDESGGPIPFSAASRTFLPMFCNNASVAIERGIMTRELVLRMMRMAELRDRTETGAHVQRVGAYSAEIYNKWALMHRIDEKERKHTKDLIRIAAMLHDVGKVGIPDTILKKKARLTRDEYAKMKFHTIHGARLFANPTSELDAMSGDIAANHHEKWDGRGYPGEIEDIFCSPRTGLPKKGEEIPLSARICALADVFDALASERSYKEPWPDDKIFSLIDEESGKHFDPDVVDAFFAVIDVIKAIRKKFKEEDRDIDCAVETIIGDN